MGRSPPRENHANPEAEMKRSRCAPQLNQPTHRNRHEARETPPWHLSDEDELQSSKPRMKTLPPAGGGRALILQSLTGRERFRDAQDDGEAEGRGELGTADDTHCLPGLSSLPGYHTTISGGK